MKCVRPWCVNEANPKPRAQGLCHSCFVVMLQRYDKPGRCVLCDSTYAVEQHNITFMTDGTHIDGQADLHICGECFLIVRRDASFREVGEA
jgi:hypothetical protein